MQSKKNSQEKVIGELRRSFDNATTFATVAAPAWVSVFMTMVSSDCKTRYVNEFRVGGRGGLKIIKQEFDNRGPL